MKAIVVTHKGPCYVDNATADQIAQKSKTFRRFKDQILYMQRFDPKLLDIRVTDGEIPEIGSFDEFETKFILEEPPYTRPEGRNIVL